MAGTGTIDFIAGAKNWRIDAGGECRLAKHCNHQLSAMACPASLADVDLFGPGAAEHWYEAYDILHAEAPVLRLRTCTLAKRWPLGLLRSRSQRRPAA